MSPFVQRLTGCVFISASLIVTAWQSHTPAVYEPSKPSTILDLATLVPARLGQWQQTPDQHLQAPMAPIPPYTQLLERIYHHSSGAWIMLSIAYGEQQLGEELQPHRPESCYQAQGFTITRSQDTKLQQPGIQLPIRRLIAQRHQRHELISYWLVQGDQAVLPGISRLAAQWQALLLGGHASHGMVIRISSLGSHAEATYRQHDRFILDLLNTLSTTERMSLAGRPVPMTKESL